jgi:methylase of polypeptide subunit release factors
MDDKQRTYGQFETPIDVADLLLGFCLRRPADRMLDPSCGNGALLSRAAGMQRWLDPWHDPSDALWGVELDSETAAEAQDALPQAHIINRDFFDLEPEPDRLFDAIVGNPPYTRAEWIERLVEESRQAGQLPMFDGGETAETEVQVPTGRRYPFLGRRAGLHAYFFIHGTEFLREGGRFGFVVPNSWLDVAYGERLKQFLLEHYQILALIESNVERWFVDARVNTCLVILEKCGDAERRAANRVRLIRLFRPLSELIPFPENDRQRLSHMERLVSRMLPGADQRGQELAVRVVGQRELTANEKWGVTLRAPAVYRHQLRQANLAPLKMWATVRRGYTTGANAFFYLDQETAKEREVESQFLRPLLKSLRSVDRRRVTAADCCDLQLFWSGSEPIPRGSAAADYIAWGEAQGYHLRRTCAARRPWYALPRQEPAALLLAKGIWLRHFAPVLDDDVRVDQQLYRLRLADGVPVLAAAALLNCAWTALQLELCGRVNFGEGVLWLAAYEVEDLHLPDPRYLTDGQLSDLVSAFEPLLDRPLGTMPEESATDTWAAFDGIVATIIGYGAEEATAVNDGLLERLAARRAKAGKSLEGA